MSMPAVSAKRALGASYAVIIVIFCCWCLSAVRSARVSFIIDAPQQRLHERNVVDQPGPAGLRRNDEGRLAVEVGDGHVIHVEPVQYRPRGADGVFLPPVRRQAGLQGPRYGQGPRPVVLRQAGVARRQRQAVGVSHYRYDVDLQVKIQITDDLLDHGDLLRVLLPEERDMGLDGREELHADRRDAAEVPWPAFAFEPNRRTLDVDPRAESGWIQLFDGRRKDDVDAGSRGS